MRKLSLVLPIILLLSGCKTPFNSFYLPFEETSQRVSDCYQPCPIFCYRTLAAAECYPHPQHGRESQLISAYEVPLNERRCSFVPQ